jgi:Fe-S-cluster containining protein
MLYQANLEIIAKEAEVKAGENDEFLRSLRTYNDAELDAVAHRVNNAVSASIDCTACGNCCNTLVINVAREEIPPLAAHLGLSEKVTKEQYIEESLAGNCFINTMPCHFFREKKCTIYEHRFTECRDFPHLHKPGFKARLAGTLGHYGRCPIIYNVIEVMKSELGFGERHDQ